MLNNEDAGIVRDYIKHNEKVLEAYELFLKKQQLEIEYRDLLLEALNSTIDVLLMKIKNADIEMLGKKDIMQIFDKESDFALRFLRLAKQLKLGTQIGKEYYISREDLKKMLKDYKGLKLEL